MKTAPLFENIPHLYEKNGVLAPHFEGFQQNIYNLFTEIDIVSGNSDIRALKNKG